MIRTLTVLIVCFNVYFFLVLHRKLLQRARLNACTPRVRRCSLFLHKPSCGCFESSSLLMVQRLLFSRRSLRKSPFSISFCHFCFFIIINFQANIPIFFLPVLLCLLHLLDDLCLRTVCGLVGPFGYLCLFILATEFLLLLLFVCCYYCCLFVVVFFGQHFNEVFSSAFRFDPVLLYYSLGDDEVDQARMGLKEPFRGNSIFFSFQFCVSHSIPSDRVLGGGG